MLTRWDKMIVIITLAAGLFLSAGMLIFQWDRPKADIAVIYVDGEIYKKVALNEINYGQVIEIKTKYGYNRIEMTEEGIKMTEADCPGRDCVKHGAAMRTNAEIVCVPHHLTVRLQLQDDGGVDTIAH